MKLRYVWALGAVAALCAIPQAGAFNPQPDPPALQALIDDINQLPAVQNPQPFLAKALAARESAMRGQPCVAKSQIDALRNQVSAKLGKKGISDNTWAGIDGDAVRVLIGLLLAPDSSACGGATVPSNGGTEPTVQVTDSDQTGLTLHVSFPDPAFTARNGNGVSYLDMSMDGLGGVGLRARQRHRQLRAGGDDEDGGGPGGGEHRSGAERKLLRQPLEPEPERLPRQLAGRRHDRQRRLKRLRSV